MRVLLRARTQLALVLEVMVLERLVVPLLHPFFIVGRRRGLHRRALAAAAAAVPNRGRAGRHGALKRVMPAAAGTTAAKRAAAE